MHILVKSHSHHYPGLLGRFRSKSGLQKIQKLFSNLSNLEKKLVENWKSCIINKTDASERSQVRTWGRQTKLVSFPRRHLTSLRPCTSRLSRQNGEICLQKYLSIGGKLSITNYLKQNAVSYRSHLTIKNNLNVEKKVYYFESKHNFPPKKVAWGMRRDKHTKKLENNNYAGTLPCKVFITSQGH